MNPYLSNILPDTARAVSLALEEMGEHDGREIFCAAVTWPLVPLATDGYPIAVTPEIPALLLQVVNGGQLLSLMQSGVSSQELLQLSQRWQAGLSDPADPGDRLPNR